MVDTIWCEDCNEHHDREANTIVIDEDEFQNFVMLTKCPKTGKFMDAYVE